MAQIDKPNLHFNIVTYSNAGDGAKAVTGVGFQPDLVWLKNRTSAYHGQIHDAVRGASAGALYTSTAAVEDSGYPISSFDSDGFTTGSQSTNISQNSASQVAWNWKAGNSAGSSNTDGSITSTVSANTTAGFSIVKWAGNSSASATVGHGLGATPACIICKEMNGTDYWHMYHQDLTTNHNLFLNVTNASSAPSDGTLANVGSSTFGFQGSTNVVAVNESGKNNIAYCFVEKKGYSKFGKYTGNGNANGTFVYTGFVPSFVMIKRTDAITDWMMFDNKRTDGNPNLVNKYLLANDSGTEGSNSTTGVDFLSNGFKSRNTFASVNASGGSYTYMAFAENPIVGSNNSAATAR